jgi:hypothetical protein
MVLKHDACNDVKPRERERERERERGYSTGPSQMFITVLKAATILLR